MLQQQQQLQQQQYQWSRPFPRSRPRVGLAKLSIRTYGAGGASSCFRSRIWGAWDSDRLLPLFPDSKARLLPLLTDPDKTSAKAGFRFCHEKQLLATCLSRIHYDGPVELLSMWACFFGDPDIAGVVATMGLGWLQLNAEALKRDRILYEQTNEITPNLAVLVSGYLKSNMYKHKM